mgnify:FL=1
MKNGQQIIFKHPVTGEVLAGCVHQTHVWHVRGRTAQGFRIKSIREWCDAEAAWEAFNEQYPTYFNFKNDKIQ